jgi:acyl carrier protein
MPEPSAVEAAVSEALARSDIKYEADLLILGTLDSLGILELLTNIEDQLEGVILDDLRLDELATAASLITAIEGRMRPTSS